MADRILSAFELAVWLQPTFAAPGSKGVQVQHNRTNGRALVLPITTGPEGLIVLSPAHGVLLLSPVKAAVIAWDDYDQNGPRAIASAACAFYGVRPAKPTPDLPLALLHGLLALGSADPEHSWDVAFADQAGTALPGWQLWRDLQPVLSINPAGFLHYPNGAMSGFQQWNASLGSIWSLVLRVAMTIERHLATTAR